VMTAEPHREPVEPDAGAGEAACRGAVHSGAGVARGEGRVVAAAE
jgi:hypothetical protein